jgi:5-methylcytosine-specific restriction enzyme A
MPTPDKILKFYQSKTWKRVRSYKRSLQRGVCEKCGKAGYEVHHKIPLTLENVDDPNISISLENLQLLCTSCHNSKRAKEKELREDVKFDQFGDLVKKSKTDSK